MNSDEIKIQKHLFWSKEELLIKKLLEFYSKPQYLNIFINIVEQGTMISLRLLDWFSTNYSKVTRTYINDIDIHSDYKDQLKGYKKQFFDPFCRRQRIFVMSETGDIRNPLKGNLNLNYKPIKNYEEFLGNSKGIVTTVGQLNFFRWCIERNIIGYILNNLQTIETNMLETSSHRKANKNKKTNNSNYVYKTVMNVTVKFD
jgi:hypothetical protein